MRVGTAEAEAGNTCELGARVFRPLAWVFDDFQALGVEIDVAVGLGEVNRRRDDAVAHSFDDLDEAHDARCRFGVPDIGLGGTEQGWVGGVAAGADDFAERGGFDGVTQDGAGAVRFDVVHGVWVYFGVEVGAL